MEVLPEIPLPRTRNDAMQVLPWSAIHLYQGNAQPPLRPSRGAQPTKLVSFVRARGSGEDTRNYTGAKGNPRHPARPVEADAARGGRGSPVLWRAAQPSRLHSASGLPRSRTRVFHRRFSPSPQSSSLTPSFGSSPLSVALG